MPRSVTGFLLQMELPSFGLAAKGEPRLALQGCGEAIQCRWKCSNQPLSALVSWWSGCGYRFTAFDPCRKQGKCYPQAHKKHKEAVSQSDNHLLFAIQRTIAGPRNSIVRFSWGQLISGGQVRKFKVSQSRIPTQSKRHGGHLAGDFFSSRGTWKVFEIDHEISGQF